MDVTNRTFFFIRLIMRIPIAFFYPKGTLKRTEFFAYWVLCEFVFFWLLTTKIHSLAKFYSHTLAVYFFDLGIYPEINQGMVIWLFGEFVPVMIYMYAFTILFIKRFRNIGHHAYTGFVLIFIYFFIPIILDVLDSGFLINMWRDYDANYFWSGRENLYKYYNFYYTSSTSLVYLYSFSVKDKNTILRFVNLFINRKH